MCVDITISAPTVQLSCQVPTVTTSEFWTVIARIGAVVCCKVMQALFESRHFGATAAVRVGTPDLGCGCFMWFIRLHTASGNLPNYCPTPNTEFRFFQNFRNKRPAVLMSDQNPKPNILITVLCMCVCTVCTHNAQRNSTAVEK